MLSFDYNTAARQARRMVVRVREMAAAADPSAGRVTPGMAGTLTAAGLAGPLQRPIVLGENLSQASSAGEVKFICWNMAGQPILTCTHSSLQGVRIYGALLVHSGKK